MGRKKLKDRQKIDISPIYAIQGKCFGVVSYRGFAPLSVLARMSRADEYHQVNNPTGTQRNLNRKHAREAYDYAQNRSNKKDALWPEIILNIRKSDTLKITPKALTKGPKDAKLTMVKIQIDWGKIKTYKDSNDIAISRVDGNHRLFFAGGEIAPKNYPPLDNVYSPFCITHGVSINDEKEIFKTINREQQRLNVSHLLRLKQQLSSDDELWQKDRPLWIVKRLAEDRGSPFFNAVHKGGKKTKGETYLIKQKSLFDGVKQLLSNFSSYSGIHDQEKLLSIVINFYNAVKSLWQKEWADSKKYKLMTNTGLQSLGIVGGKLMNELFLTRSLKMENFKIKLIPLQKEIPNCWESKGEFMAGKSGRPGAQKIAEEIMSIISIIDDSELEV
ncbi:DGQHR domain-containing protein [candidate division WOR-3 bacterium]|nr:DGQHR domain-containing protein [candidate division WOR-3 bacterium]